MSELNEQDWILVNAYHDGELSAEEMRALELRFASEPALTAAFKDVQTVAQSLSALRPELVQSAAMPQTRPSNKNWHPRRWLLSSAVAAALALAVVFGSAFNASPTAFDIHAELAAQTYDFETAGLRDAAAQGGAGAPDLTLANMTAVDFRALDNKVIAHYVGQNGCRLTYLRGTFNAPEGSSTSDQQIATWTSADNLRHMIVATGMDHSRFTAIADYLKLETRDRAASESVMASLSEAIRSARSCVG